MKRLFNQAILLVALSGSLVPAARAQSTLKLDSTVWAEVYRDDFRQETSLNRKEWYTFPHHGEKLENRDGVGSEWYDYNDSSLVAIVPAAGTDGVVRLTAKRWLDEQGQPMEEQRGTRTIRYRSGMLRSYIGYQNWEGHSTQAAYGVWEARIKLPTSYNAWPTFWLWSSETELDIIDGISEQGILQNVIDNLVDVAGIQPPAASKCSMHLDKPWDRGAFTNEFHVYTMVWTPEAATFFIDGRETHTVPCSQVVTRDGFPDLLLMLQMQPGAGDGPDPDPTERYAMEIDWVRLLKPRPTGNGKRYYNVDPQTYEYSPEFKSHEVTSIMQDPAGPTAQDAARNLVVNLGNTAQVFSPGTDNYVDGATQTGPSQGSTVLRQELHR